MRTPDKTKEIHSWSQGPRYNEVPLYNEILWDSDFMFVISVVNKQYKTKEIHSLGPEKFVCYIRYFVIYQISLYRISTVHVLSLV